MISAAAAAVQASPYFKFKDCCTGIEYDLRVTGSVNGFVNNSVYISLVNVGGLETGRCYSVTQLTTFDTIFWNSLPTIANTDVSSQGGTCEEVKDNGKCAPCQDPCGVCPDGYIQVGNECIKDETVPATYTGGLSTITKGDTVTSYGKFGLRLYPDITSEVKPLLGGGSPYQVKASNGVGVLITPLISGVQSNLWGSELSGCATGTSAGRLNTVGLWNDAYNGPPNSSTNGPELGFDFCVEITTTKQYLVGIAGDNKVKLYVDGTLNVFLNSTASSMTTPFNYWHVFPITLNAGQHTIRLAGINESTSQASFGGEIYDIDIATFQSILTDPAVGVGNCGNVPADLEPYIVFTTRDFIGEDIPNPAQPGVWVCPDGSTPDDCSVIPECNIQIKIAVPECPCYLLIPCEPNLGPIISNSEELFNYVNTYVEVDTETYGPICVFVAEYDNNCREAEKVEVLDSQPCPCPPKCYYVSSADGIIYVDTNNNLVELSSAQSKPYVRICSGTYPLVGNSEDNYTITTLGECENGECPTLCFKLTNCDPNSNEVIYSNTDLLIQNAFGTNNVVTINGEEGCWQVTLNDGNCNCLNVTITGRGEPDVYVANAIDTFNGYNVYEFTIDGTNYYIWYEPGKAWYITEDGYGGDVIWNEIAYLDFSGECPDSINEGINWIFFGVEGVTLDTEVCPAECICPVPVTVLQSYSTCEDCLPIIAYKFTNCKNSIAVQYSLEDYSAYVGKVVELDCGDCWKVEQIDYIPPSTQTITIQYTFDSCLECGRTYYQLADCLDPNVNIVYTYTDVSEYIGKVIKIKGCDDCFTVVGETREPVNPGVVEVTDSYIDCPECLETFPCVCSVISNTTNTEQTYCYIDCDFEQQSIVLQPGEKSDKVCVIKWIVCPEPCDCLTTTYYQEEIADPTNNITLNLELLPTGETYNGKPIYQDCFNSNTGCDPSFPPDSCFTVKYELDGCWYGAFTNNCATNIHAVFKNCSNTDCPTGQWEYIPCTRLAVTIPQEAGSVTVILTADDYTVTPFTYSGSGYTVSYNPSANLWEMYFGGKNVASVDGTNGICQKAGQPIEWGNDFFSPSSIDADIDYAHSLNVDRCALEIPVLNTNDEIQGYIEYFGNCIDNECPVKPLPKRKVKPGYSTPICDPDKYEKITCKASEIYYKQVMRLRYGISNCCPEDEEKWLIKKELIDLQALVDPDYICKPVTTCCNQPLSTCGCSCNQTLKTCNS